MCPLFSKSAGAYNGVDYVSQRCIRFLGNLLIDIFGILSGPGAFFLFRIFIMALICFVDHGFMLLALSFCDICLACLSILSSYLMSSLGC